MGIEKESELAVAKQKILELEALAASLQSKIQVLESDNKALRDHLLYYGKVKQHHGALNQGPMEIQSTFLKPTIEEFCDEGCETKFMSKIIDNNHGSNSSASVRKSENSKGFQFDIQSLRVQMTERGQMKQSPMNITICPTTTEAENKKGDISQHSWRHVALKIMYLGARFHGFASASAAKRTVEDELFKALERTKLLMMGRLEAKYSRCGRTDRGVSANCQVVALLLRSRQKSTDSRNCLAVDQNSGSNQNSSEDPAAAANVCFSQESISVTTSDEKEIDYAGVLNRALPTDIRILGWCAVPNAFHARFSCISREYKYFFVNDDLDIEAMRVAGKKFEGEHDFRNFCKMDAENVHSFKRRILTFEIIPCRDWWGGVEIWMFRVKGTAFLWHQIRCMAAILLLIGQQYESPSVVDDLLNIQKTKRKPQYIMAPDANLVLQSCEFQGLSFVCSQGTARLIHKHLQNLLREHLLAAAMLKEAYEQLPIFSGSDHPRQGLQKKILHVPLSCRPTEPSYEERQSKIQKGKQKMPTMKDIMVDDKSKT